MARLAESKAENGVHAPKRSSASGSAGAEPLLDFVHKRSCQPGLAKIVEVIDHHGLPRSVAVHVLPASFKSIASLMQFGDAETPMLRKRISGIPGIDEAGAAGTEQFLDLLDRFLNHARRLAGLQLILQFYQGSIGRIEAPR
jgi:hypothetical protein